VAITLVEPRERPLLKNIERLTGRKIDVRALPTVADLRARRLERTQASLREALLLGGDDGARAVVEALATEFELFEIATAAVRLIREASEPDPPRTSAEDERPAARSAPLPSAVPGELTRVYVSVGRAAGVRPGDLVGAITGEADVPGEAVGAIEIADRFSLVEVRESVADRVIEALREATIRGRRVTASRYREPRSRKAPARKAGRDR
jgi:ATP-dependent RNA helicase DeaD